MVLNSRLYEWCVFLYQRYVGRVLLWRTIWSLSWLFKTLLESLFAVCRAVVDQKVCGLIPGQVYILICGQDAGPQFAPGSLLAVWMQIWLGSVSG